MKAEPDSSIPLWVRAVTVPCVTGFLSAALGLFVLVGWVLSIPWLKSFLPGAVDMKANTAFGLLVAGVSLCLLDAAASRRQVRMGQGLALAVAVLGFATVGEWAFDWHLGIDELLFLDPTGAHGRMSSFSAVVFAAIGLGLAALPVRSLRWLVRVAATLALLVGGVSLTGYLWNASELVTGRFLPPVAANTAAAFILLGIGAFTATRPPAARTPGIVGGVFIR
jgi:hypothetical protein